LIIPSASFPIDNFSNLSFCHWLFRVKEAVKTIKNVHGVEVIDMTAKVDPNTGNINEYRVGIKLAFGVER
jgi:hypothetical protein